MKLHLALITEQRYLSERPTDPLHQNVLLDDRQLASALGPSFSTTRVDWRDATLDWASFDTAIIRTPWDYNDSVTQFCDCLQGIERVSRLLNPWPLVEWNLPKTYLQDLDTAGLPIVPSHWIMPKLATSLAEQTRLTGWQQMVLKPVISASARETYRFSIDEIAAIEPSFQRCLQTEAMMLQEFQPAVLKHGEVSHIVLDGRYSHSVRKRAAEGDFRVQEDFGGTVEDYLPGEEERSLAEAAVAACPEPPVYARVDLLQNQRREWMISELELIEPELWLHRCDSAAEHFADALKARL